MQGEGLLALFANVAVVFAGFTGLVSVVGRSGESSAATAQQSEARLLVEYSIILLLESVTPLVLWHAGVPEAIVWRIVGGVLAVGTVFYYVIRGRELKASMPGQFWVGFTLDLSFATALGVATAGLWGAQMLPAIYLSFLLWKMGIR